MIKNGIKILSLCSIVVGLSLLSGSVYAAYSVEDNADKIGARIGLEDVITVRFMNENNEVAHEEFLNSGDTLPAISNPTLSGYTFDGWSTDSTSYIKTTDNLATKHYTVDTTYYPRFASYGYQIGSDDAAHVANAKTPANNVEISSGASLKLGTYIHNKSSLENATNAVTISKAGSYALVCNEGGSWSATHAGTIGDWNIDRYITVTRTGKWTEKNTYARFYFASSSPKDVIMTQVSGETYYAYHDYTATQVEFGAIYADSLTQDAVLDNYANIQYRTDKYTLDNTTHYDIPDVAYYLTGDFASLDWGIESNYAFTVDPEDANHYTLTDVSLSAGDKVKARDNANNWFTSDDPWPGCGFSNDTDNNVVVSKNGVYDISLYITGSNHIVFDSQKLETTFNVIYPDGGDIYIAFEFNSWKADDAKYKMALTDATTGTYSLTVNIPSNSATLFKYVINGDWDTLNPDGNRTMTIGGVNEYEYVAPDGKVTITFNVNYGTVNGQSLFVTGAFSGWACSTDYVLTWTNGNNWVGSFDFDEGTQFKVVVGADAGGNVIRWSSGSNLVADADKTINTSDVTW